MIIKDPVSVGGQNLPLNNVLDARRMYTETIKTIRSARIHAGLSIEEMANAIGVSKMTVSNMENHRVAASLDTVVRCLAVLNIDLMLIDRSSLDHSDEEQEGGEEYGDQAG